MLDNIRVYISSTHLDLVDYRKAILKAINSLRKKYEGLECINQTDEEPDKPRFDLIKKCDLFIGVYAWKYGIIEQEYRYARKQKIPSFCYLINENIEWNPTFIDGEPFAEKLKLFKSRISTNHIKNIFEEPRDLRLSIINDLNEWLEANKPDLIKTELKPDKNIIEGYFQKIQQKYESLNMIGFNRNFDMKNVEIPLKVYVAEEFKHDSKHNKVDQKIFLRALRASDLVGLPYNVSVIVGEAGMGKTTALQSIAYLEVSQNKKVLPILINLPDFALSKKTLESFLIDSVEKFGKEIKEESKKVLVENKLLVLLDGLDEVGVETYSSVINRIEVFIRSHKECKMVITARKECEDILKIADSIMEIDEMPIDEIEAFVKKWFSSGNDLIANIKQNYKIQEIAGNPFLLSMLCFIYEKNGKIPTSRVELYQKTATTLLELCHVNKMSREVKYSRILKEKVLEHVSYYFFIKRMDEFPYDMLVEQIANALYNIGEKGNSNEILSEISEISGLIKIRDDKCSFIHRTFMEYFIASKIRKVSQASLINFSTSKSQWKEPIKLYASQITSIEDGTNFIKKLNDKDCEFAIKCYEVMGKVIEPDVIIKLLKDTDVSGRISIVKTILDKITKPDALVGILKELLTYETNGEVIYWSVLTLEEMKEVPGAMGIIYQRLDNGADERYKEYIERDMVHISGGRFMMGSNENNDESPPHKVKVSNFAMSKYLITNKLYEEFDPDHSNKRDRFSNEDNQPVVNINWYEAFIFCRWLGCRLPSEAEWEYACRADSKGYYNTKKELSADLANFHDVIGKTSAVGKYEPNKWGLYDMHGNVDEWCLDWYDYDYYIQCKEENIIENPKGPESGIFKVLRGGNWGDFAKFCSSVSRTSFQPSDRFPFVGFRAVKL